MHVYIEHLIHELLENHGGKLVSVMEPEIRAIIQAAVDQERERCARIAHDRATQWDAIKESRPDDPPMTLAAADARWHEACDIAALILAP